MNKTLKIMGITAGGMAVLGIVFIIIGAITGGVQIIASDVSKGILSISPNISFDFDMFPDEEFSNMTSIVEKDTFSVEEVNSIIFEAEYGEYKIVGWDENYYHITSESESDINKIKYSINDGTLRLRIKGKKIVMGDNIKATLYVPNTEIIECAEINMGAGELICENISGIKEWEVNVGAGQGDFNNITAEKFDINVGAGDGNITNGKFDSAELKVGAGDLDVEGTVNGDIDVKCGVGNMDIALSNSYTDYNYKVSVGLGEVTVGGEKYSGVGSDVSVDNDSDNDIEVDCGIGDVTIELSNVAN